MTGEVDAIVGSVASILSQANRAHLAHRLVISDIALQVSPLAFLTSDTAVSLRADLNTEIARVLSSGEKARLKQLWFGARAAPITGREALVFKLSVVATIVFLAYWAWLHFGVLRRAKRLQAKSDLLSDTLDETGVALIIFDRSMRPEYWNSAFKDNFPRQVALIRSGTTMEELIKSALTNGSLGVPLEPAEAAAERARKSRPSAESAVVAANTVSRASPGAAVRTRGEGRVTSAHRARARRHRPRSALARRPGP